MKRETFQWLRRLRDEDMDKSEHPATDVLRSNARQRAEIRRLRAKAARRVRCAACGALLAKEDAQPARDPFKWACKNVKACLRRCLIAVFPKDDS